MSRNNGTAATVDAPVVVEDDTWKARVFQAVAKIDEEDEFSGQEYRDAERQAQLAVALQTRLQQFGIPGEPQGGAIIVAGYTFSISDRYGILQVLQPCPNDDEEGCEGYTPLSIHDIQDLSRALKTVDEVQYKLCRACEEQQKLDQQEVARLQYDELHPPALTRFFSGMSEIQTNAEILRQLQKGPGYSVLGANLTFSPIGVMVYAVMFERKSRYVADHPDDSFPF